MSTMPDNIDETVTLSTDPAGWAMFNALPFAKGTIVVRTPGFVVSIGPKRSLAFYRETINRNREESLLKDVTIPSTEAAKQ